MLDVAHHRIDEIDEPFFFRRRFDWTLGHDIGRAAAADHVEQVDAGQPGTDEKNDDAADAERHADPAAASAASVLNVAPSPGVQRMSASRI